MWRLGRQIQYLIVSALIQPRANARSPTPNRGKNQSQGLVCSSRQHRVLPHRLRFITTWSLVPLRHNLLENVLARPIGSPPLRRRVCLARWSQVIHHYPPFLERGSHELCGSFQFPRSCGPQFIFMRWGKHVNGEIQLEKYSNRESQFPPSCQGAMGSLMALWCPCLVVSPDLMNQWRVVGWCFNFPEALVRFQTA